MELKFAEILKVMDLLVESHRELVKVENAKIEAIINQDWKNLENLLKESEIILKNIEVLEAERVRLMGEGKSINDIIHKFPEQIAEDLMKNREDLIEVIKTLKKANETTRSMISDSLEIINFTLDLLIEGGNSVKTYGGTGQETVEKNSTSSLVFDIKA